MYWFHFHSFCRHQQPSDCFCHRCLGRVCSCFCGVAAYFGVRVEVLQMCWQKQVIRADYSLFLNHFLSLTFTPSPFPFLPPSFLSLSVYWYIPPFVAHMFLWSLLCLSVSVPVCLCLFSLSLSLSLFHTHIHSLTHSHSTNTHPKFLCCVVTALIYNYVIGNVCQYIGNVYMIPTAVIGTFSSYSHSINGGRERERERGGREGETTAID